MVGTADAAVAMTAVAGHAIGARTFLVLGLLVWLGWLGFRAWAFGTRPVVTCRHRPGAAGARAVDRDPLAARPVGRHHGRPAADRQPRRSGPVPARPGHVPLGGRRPRPGRVGRAGPGVAHAGDLPAPRQLVPLGPRRRPRWTRPSPSTCSPTRPCTSTGTATRRRPSAARCRATHGPSSCSGARAEQGIRRSRGGSRPRSTRPCPTSTARPSADRAAHSTSPPRTAPGRDVWPTDRTRLQNGSGRREAR